MIRVFPVPAIQRICRWGLWYDGFIAYK